MTYQELLKYGKIISRIDSTLNGVIITTKLYEYKNNSQYLVTIIHSNTISFEIKKIK